MDPIWRTGECVVNAFYPHGGNLERQIQGDAARRTPLALTDANGGVVPPRRQSWRHLEISPPKPGLQTLGGEGNYSIAAYFGFNVLPRQSFCLRTECVRDV